MFATANVTAWSSAREWLEEMKKDDLPAVLCLQEHKLTTQALIDEAATFAHGKGYTSLWTPAVPGKGRKAAGGTAILARESLGLARVKAPTGKLHNPRQGW